MHCVRIVLTSCSHFRMKAAPDINSSIAFPGLSSAGEDTAPKGAWGKKL